MWGTLYNNKINWTVSPVILETDASLMLVIQWLSDHKLLNKCAAGRLWWKLEASREWDLGLWYMWCQPCDEVFINFCHFCLLCSLHMWSSLQFLVVAEMITAPFQCLVIEMEVKGRTSFSFKYIVLYMVASHQKCNAMIDYYTVSDLLAVIFLMEAGSRTSHQRTCMNTAARQLFSIVVNNLYWGQPSGEPVEWLFQSWLCFFMLVF